jgi:hypothetical protein
MHDEPKKIKPEHSTQKRRKQGIWIKSEKD